MKTIPTNTLLKLSALLILSISLTACGGGGSDSNSSGSVLTQNQQKLVNGLTQRSTDFYLDLQSHLTTLQTASNDYCANQNDAGLQTLRTEWKNAFKSWMSAQWVIRGPIDDKFRFNRIESWPLADSRRVQLTVDQDIANSAELTQSYIANRPVQTQGFPAMEYLLFSPSVENSSITTRKCDLLKAISANMVTISSDVNSEWVAYAKDIKNPGPEIQFADINSSINFFANLLLNQLIILKDDKLGAPLGFNKLGEAGPASPESGEAWISRQSLPAILINIQTLQALYKDEGGFGIEDFLISLNKPEINQGINTKFSTLISKIQGAISAGLTLHDNATDSRLIKLYADVRALEVAIQNQVFPAIGAAPTFNFNDGD